MQFIFLIFVLFYIGVTQSSIFSDIKETFPNILDSGKPRKRTNLEINPLGSLVHYRASDDAIKAQMKAKILEKARTREQNLNNGRDILPSRLSMNPLTAKEYYHMDPVLNQIKRRSNLPNIKIHILRRKNEDDSSSSSRYSTSLELKDWKDEFNELWIQKKFEAVNSTDMRGDVVNMAAARPWGVPCGDPNQHDMPWGNCMLPVECEPEFRIYRGDNFCGRTQFVCCALQITNYDLYQGFDVSFADSSFATDSAEKKQRDLQSKKSKKKKSKKSEKDRHRQRRKRKKKIKKSIKNIVREIKKILNNVYRNATNHRQKRTKLLKKYIKDLKSQYKKDRNSVRGIHIADLDRIDTALELKLNQIRDLNKNFLMNSTFRQIIINGTITKTGARMLAEAYPELKEYLPSKWMRRDGGGEAEKGSSSKGSKDYLEYDIEYGALYY